jgi:hypothetical protein
MLVKTNPLDANFQKEIKSKVLVLFDWENAFFSLFSEFGPNKLNLEYRIKKLMEWIKSDVGELLGGFGFVFAPNHFSSYHRKICIQNKIRIMICPKEASKKKGEKARDTVDETIINFGNVMLRHPDVGFICLISGDEDFVPLLENSKKNNVKIALVAPTLNSLSTNQNIVKLIDCHPETGKKMALRLDQV